MTYGFEGLAGSAKKARVRFGRLAPGDTGTRATLDEMRKLALRGSTSLEVRETAVQIIRGVEAHDRVGELRRIFEWVRDNIRFTNDVWGVETLQAADYTLRLRAGDCDDRAVLLAAMLRSIGVPAELKFRVIAANPGAKRTFSHVYLVANISGRQIAMDPTYATNTLGWQYRGAYRTGEVSV